MTETSKSTSKTTANTVESFVTHILEFMVSACFVAIFALVILLVVLRYVFNSSITGANELITVLFVYTTSIGAAVAIGRNEHIAVTFIVDRFPFHYRRFVDSISLILIALMNFVLAWEGLQWIETTGNFIMPSTGLPRSVAQFSVPFGCGLAVVYCLTRLFFISTKKEKVSYKSANQNG